MFRPALACVFNLLLICVGAALLLKQSRHERLYDPAKAVILSSELSVEKASDGEGQDTYKPVVRYRFVGGDRWRESTAVVSYPLGYQTSRRWAEGVVARYRPGREAEAYVNRENPEDAFLVKKTATVPVLSIASGLLGLAVVGCRILPKGWVRRAPQMGLFLLGGMVGIGMMMTEEGTGPLRFLLSIALPIAAILGNAYVIALDDPPPDGIKPVRLRRE